MKNVFIADEVANLDKHQTGGRFHPFTCANRGDGNHRVAYGDLGALIPTVRGWVCPFCDYTQDWAHGSMKEGATAPHRPSFSGGGQAPFQDRVQPWMMACFGPIVSADRLERGDRLLEEVFELLQSGDYPRERIRALEEYTYARPKGEPYQEVGGVMVTLAAYSLAHGLDMHEAAETELARIWTKVEKIRAKQAAKPTGSALPVAALSISPTPASSEVIERLVKALEAAETYVIDGVTTAKQNLEMNAGYPTRRPRYEAELQEARDIYAECQAARRAALAAVKENRRG